MNKTTILSSIGFLALTTTMVFGAFSFNLETAVWREKAMQAIHGHREFENLVVTLLVMRGLSNSLGA